MTPGEPGDSSREQSGISEGAADDASEPVRPEPPETDGGDDEANGSLISRLGRWASSAFGQNGRETEVTEDLRAALVPVLAGCNPGERAMILNILKMRDVRVVDVMTPRADIEAVSVDDGLDDVIAAFRRGAFSRLPVYRETLDDPIGFVHLKDVALKHGFGGTDAEEFDLSRHLLTALFVPASMRAAALLQRMQKSRIHMALVIDEFGGVDGLVTIEDLVEQIVGDIEDEHDEAELAPWREEGERVFSASARAEIDAFEEAVGVRLRGGDADEDIETLGGLVFMLANRVPTRGEVITHPDGHEFEVTDADPRRIKRIRVVLAGPEGATQQAAAE